MAWGLIFLTLTCSCVVSVGSQPSITWLSTRNATATIEAGEAASAYPTERFDLSVPIQFTAAGRQVTLKSCLASPGTVTGSSFYLFNDGDIVFAAGCFMACIPELDLEPGWPSVDYCDWPFVLGEVDEPLDSMPSSPGDTSLAFQFHERSLRGAVAASYDRGMTWLLANASVPPLAWRGMGTQVTIGLSPPPAGPANATTKSTGATTSQAAVNRTVYQIHCVTGGVAIGYGGPNLTHASNAVVCSVDGMRWFDQPGSLPPGDGDAATQTGGGGRIGHAAAGYWRLGDEGPRLYVIGGVSNWLNRTEIDDGDRTMTLIVSNVLDMACFNGSDHDDSIDGATAAADCLAGRWIKSWTPIPAIPGAIRGRYFSVLSPWRGNHPVKPVAGSVILQEHPAALLFGGGMVKSGRDRHGDLQFDWVNDQWMAVDPFNVSSWLMLEDTGKAMGPALGTELLADPDLLRLFTTQPQVVQLYGPTRKSSIGTVHDGGNYLLSEVDTQAQLMLVPMLGWGKLQMYRPQQLPLSSVNAVYDGTFDGKRVQPTRLTSMVVITEGSGAVNSTGAGGTGTGGGTGVPMIIGLFGNNIRRGFFRRPDYRCPAGQVAVTMGDHPLTPVCAVCKACDGVTHYLVTACTNGISGAMNEDTVCGACSVCAPPMEALSACNATHNTVCGIRPPVPPYFPTSQWAMDAHALAMDVFIALCVAQTGLALVVTFVVPVMSNSGLCACCLVRNRSSNHQHFHTSASSPSSASPTLASRGVKQEPIQPRASGTIVQCLSFISTTAYVVATFATSVSLFLFALMLVSEPSSPAPSAASSSVYIVIGRCLLAALIVHGVLTTAFMVHYVSSHSHHLSSIELLEYLSTAPHKLYVLIVALLLPVHGRIPLACLFASSIPLPVPMRRAEAALALWSTAALDIPALILVAAAVQQSRYPFFNDLPPMLHTTVLLASVQLGVGLLHFCVTFIRWAWHGGLTRLARDLREFRLDFATRPMPSWLGFATWFNNKPITPVGSRGTSQQAVVVDFAGDRVTVGLTAGSSPWEAGSGDRSAVGIGRAHRVDLQQQQHGAVNPLRS